MATQSSILAWKIPWIEESGRLPSTGSQRIRYDLMTEHTTEHTLLGKEERLEVNEGEHSHFSKYSLYLNIL